MDKLLADRFIGRGSPQHAGAPVVVVVALRFRRLSFSHPIELVFDKDGVG